MATITEDYCSREIYRLLREKGYDGEVHTTFDKKGYTQASITLQMAMKWLREVHQIAIATNCWFGGERYISWHCTIMCYSDNLKTQQDVELPYVSTYEEACKAAIKYCLENLI